MRKSGYSNQRKMTGISSGHSLKTNNENIIIS